MLLKLAAGAICGMAAGLVAGAAARVAMRMVADGVPDPIRQLPTFTVGGTAAVLIVAALVGAPFGAIFALAYDALPRPRRARGILFGVAMLVAIGPLFFSGNRDEFITYERMVLFAFLFPIAGVALGLAFGPSQRLAQRLPGAAHAVLAVIALAGGASIAAGIASFAGQAVQTHGALALAYAVPWVGLGLLAMFALRPALSSTKP